MGAVRPDSTGGGDDFQDDRFRDEDVPEKPKAPAANPNGFGDERINGGWTANPDEFKKLFELVFEVKT